MSKPRLHEVADPAIRDTIDSPAEMVSGPSVLVPASAD